MTIHELQIAERRKAALLVIAKLRNLRLRKVGKRYYRELARLANQIAKPFSYHSWGDGFEFFGEVDQAAFEIGEFCKRYGRIYVSDSKEKFGGVRVYLMFGAISLHSLLFPGWHCKHKLFPQWLWKLDIRVLSRVVGKLNNLGFVKWQTFIYRLAYKRAVAKYPIIRDEILRSADYPEFLVGL